MLHFKPLGEGFEMQTTDEEQRVMLRTILKTAMAILRDDAPYDPEHIVFGTNYTTWTHPPAKGFLYKYKNRALRGTKIEFSTGDDPEDYSDDRDKVKIVPAGVRIVVEARVANLPDTEIKSLLHLEDYWVDGEGNREYGNEMMVRDPKMPNLQSFRYRSKDISGSKFPVNVDLFYVNPPDGSTPPFLDEVRISRAYKILTPEEREQRRLEEQQAKRHKYGLMNLCTGMLCPETGIWQGYTKISSSDIHMIRKGHTFPDVRTLTPREQAERNQYTNLFEPGQWMWVKEYVEPEWMKEG
ncbi:hypothetical protein [Burkholderia ambifaria]|nr:hypothetical protein [Burkholderia ambifaria]UZU02209.1 hypothetical protein OR987_16095 [Burkholderia ambifaria]UZU08761.1 hypothetical protein OR988_16090 [Burkholderia ambifaria]WDS12992.1 hypothetical protein OR984_06180 [Burkholderia ambifaria]WDS26129.1 hypothetical protein OR983_06200 [Burkholderia ambifaria]